MCKENEHDYRKLLEIFIKSGEKIIILLFCCKCGDTIEKEIQGYV